MTADEFMQKLATRPLQQCSGLDKLRCGWVPCRGDRLVHLAGQNVLFAFGTEERLLPTSVINRFARERVSDIEAQQGYKCGRRELAGIKEGITEDLLPQSFVIQHVTYAWLDAINGRLIIDAASVAKAEELLEFLNRTLDDLPVKPLHTELSPVAAMTDWLASGNAPDGFTIDRELELRATGESRATVRYVNHALDGEEIQSHIAAGKRATRLGLTWNDRISFVLTEQLQIKRLEFLDIIKESSTEHADTADEIFEVDFILMTGELSKMLTDLINALGGELQQK